MPNRRNRRGNNFPTDFTYISPCVKLTLFFFNFLFWLIGGAIIGIGGWSYFQEYAEGASESVNNAFNLVLNISLVVMICGGSIFIISFFGCIGALRENLCLLRIYSFILLLLFLGEMVVATLAFVFPTKFSDLAKKGLSNDPIVKYRDDVNLQNFIDIMQQEFQCCGISHQSYKDWSKNIYFNCTVTNNSTEKCGVPYSCCQNPRNLDSGLLNIQCGYHVQNLTESEVRKRIFTMGCVEALEEYAKKNLHIIAGVLLSVALIQLFAIYLSRTLLGQIEAQLSQWT